MSKKIISIIIFFFLIIIIWCWRSWDKVQIWDNLTITYSANFEDWSIFKDQQSIKITVGSWEIIKWIEDWIIWIKQWDKKEIFITPENGYKKEYDTLKVQKITKIIFDRMWINPEIWKTYKIWDLEGIVKWTEWNWDFQIFMLDTNPRNTYENLIFKIKIDKIAK